MTVFSDPDGFQSEHRFGCNMLTIHSQLYSKEGLISLENASMPDLSGNKVYAPC